MTSKVHDARRYMAYDSGADFVDEIIDRPSVFVDLPAPDNWATKKVQKTTALSTPNLDFPTACSVMAF